MRCEIIQNEMEPEIGAKTMNLSGHTTLLEHHKLPHNDAETFKRVTSK